MLVVQLLCCLSRHLFSLHEPCLSTERIDLLHIPTAQFPRRVGGVFTCAKRTANEFWLFATRHTGRSIKPSGKWGVERNFQKKIWLFQQRDWQFFCTLQQIIVISDISPPSRTCLKSMILLPRFPPVFRRGFRCHPVSQRAGVLRSGVQSSSRSSFCCTNCPEQKPWEKLHGKHHCCVWNVGYISNISRYIQKLFLARLFCWWQRL